MNALLTVVYFLGSLFFSLLIYALLLRLAMRFFHFSSLHPISQLILTLTEPLVSPLRRILPSPIASRFDKATILVLFVADALKFFLFSLLFFQQMLPLSWFIVLIPADILVNSINLLLFMLLVRIVMSWIQPGWQNPINDLFSVCTNPLLRPLQQRVPMVAGFDFSPMVLMLILFIIGLFIQSSLPIRLP